MSRNDENIKQLVQGHAAMVNVLENRALRLNAALTFWKKRDIPQLVAYLIRMKDDGLYVDVLPFVTKCIAEDETSNKQQVTLGACLELMPAVENLLRKKYEDYLIVCLDFMRTVIKRWYNELRAMSKQKPGQELEQSLSIPPVYTKLLSMTESIERLSKRNGNIGSKAKVVLEMLNQL
uniref:KATNB1-like protein 1 n=1 Tax=Phallusia mammillata TaxID=59560 RepID=A0A6F9DG95_9ASCI|nr:KATNB1-like protein 1 [Phallusia mammillata]